MTRKPYTPPVVRDVPKVPGIDLCLLCGKGPPPPAGRTTCDECEKEIAPFTKPYPSSADE